MSVRAQLNQFWTNANARVATWLENAPGETRAIETGCIVAKVASVALALFAASAIVAGGIIGGSLALYGCFVLFKVASNIQNLVTDAAARTLFEAQRAAAPDYRSLAQLILRTFLPGTGLETFIPRT